MRESDFASIRTMVESIVRNLVGGRESFFTTGKVVKRDVTRKLVWVTGYGTQAVPVVSFDYDVTYYDTDAAGVVHRKVAKATPLVPDVGEIVFVANEWGLKRLPRCIGVLKGTGWMESE